jgi:hypothetical protein
VNQENPDPLTGPRYWMTYVFAVAISVFFVLGCLLLFLAADNGGVNETIWGRYVYVFGGLEAIVFTAVGWIFGREVNRAAADTVTKHAEVTTRQLQQANASIESTTREARDARAANVTLTEQAANGRALAHAVRSFAAESAAPAGAATRSVGADPLAGLLEMANTLMPPGR